jgi:hypothetical protein
MPVAAVVAVLQLTEQAVLGVAATVLLMELLIPEAVEGAVFPPMLVAVVPAS